MASFPTTERIFTIIAKSSKGCHWVSPTPRTFRSLSEATEFIEQNRKDLGWDDMFTNYRVLNGEVLL